MLIASVSLGFAVATLIAITAPLDQIPCGGSSGCAAVARSDLSRTLPIPQLGLIYYGILAVTLAVQTSFESVRKALQLPFELVSLLGCAVSLLLTFYSLTAIHAACIWCLVSAVVCCVIPTVAITSKPGLSLSRRGFFTVLISTVIAFLAPILILNWSGYWSLYDGRALEKASFRELVPAGTPSIGSESTTKQSRVLIAFVDLDCSENLSALGKLLKWQAQEGGRSLYIRQYPRSSHVLSFDSAERCICSARRGALRGFLTALLNRPPYTSSELDEILLSASPTHKYISTSELTDARRELGIDVAFAHRIALKTAPFIIDATPPNSPRAISIRELTGQE